MSADEKEAEKYTIEEWCDGDMGYNHVDIAKIAHLDGQAVGEKRGYLAALEDVEKVLRSAPPMLGLAFMRDLEQLKSRAGGKP